MTTTSLKVVPGNAALPVKTTAVIQGCIAAADKAVSELRNRRLAPREIEMVVGAVIDWLALHKPRALNMRG